MSLPKRFEMSLYSHPPDCKRQLSPHDPSHVYLGVFCKSCSDSLSFCPVCKENVHFPVSCLDMKKWKNREDLGAAHFQVYNECHLAWKRFDNMQRSLDAKWNSYPQDSETIQIPTIASDILWELRFALQLLKWSWVFYWRYLHRLLRYNALDLLEDAVEESLRSVAPTYGLTQIQDLERRHIWLERTRLSEAAVTVLSILSMSMPKQPIFPIEIQRWKRTPPPRPETPESTPSETESTPSPLCFIL